MLKQPELSGLLPLLPLTKDGKRQEVVEETIECLQQVGKADLLPLVYAFSALMFKKKKEQQWLKERFAVMGSILEESWAYQEMVQKGVAEGLEQGLKQGEQKGLARGLKQGEQKGLARGLKQGEQKGLEQGRKDLEHVVIRFVELHFQDLVPLAKKQATKAKNSQQLQRMLDNLFVAHTDDEARAVLLTGLE